MTVSIADLKRLMAKKSDAELCDVLHGHSGDYTPEAIEAAKQEFASRNLDAPTLSTVNTEVADQVQNENQSLGWGLRILSFFVSTLFLGIPVILAHRHYVEKGARLKAREWGRWALFGLIFYVGLAILRSLIAALTQP